MQEELQVIAKVEAASSGLVKYGRRFPDRGGGGIPVTIPMTKLWLVTAPFPAMVGVYKSSIFRSTRLLRYERILTRDFHRKSFSNCRRTA